MAVINTKITEIDQDISINSDIEDRAGRDLGKVDIADIDSINSISGQKTMANSFPVVIASDQNDLNVNANIQIRNEDVDSTNTVPVSIIENNTNISSLNNSINVDKMTKGETIQAFDGTNSQEVDCRNYNSISIECIVSGNGGGSWTVYIYGSSESGGTFGRCYKFSAFGQVPLVTDAIGEDTNVTFSFELVPNYVLAHCVEAADGGNLIVNITPMNI